MKERKSPPKEEIRMRKTLSFTAMALALVGTTAIAEPTGTFRQAHEFGFGAQSSLDPSELLHTP